MNERAAKLLKSLTGINFRNNEKFILTDYQIIFPPTNAPDLFSYEIYLPKICLDITIATNYWRAKWLSRSLTDKGWTVIQKIFNQKMVIEFHISITEDQYKKLVSRKEEKTMRIVEDHDSGEPKVGKGSVIAYWDDNDSKKSYGMVDRIHSEDGNEIILTALNSTDFQDAGSNDIGGLDMSYESYGCLIKDVKMYYDHFHIVKNPTLHV